MTCPGARLAIAMLISASAIALVAPLWAQEQSKLDINRASLRELQELPIPDEVAENIHRYRTYVSYFNSAYDLMNVEGMTPELLQALMPLVATLPPPDKSEWQQRYDDSFRAVQDFLTQEGASEELADEFLDQLRQPRNVNRMNLFELQSLQNLSPVDAVAVLQARRASGRIENERQLRSVPGISYWGFRNLRDYVVYQDAETRNELHGDVQIVAFNTPYLLDDRDILTEPMGDAALAAEQDFEATTGWGIRGLDAANPAVLTKVRLRFGDSWKGGIMAFRDVGEENLGETVKGYLSWENRRGNAYQVDRVVAGSYRIAFGQGLVMDNSDYFLPRKIGYGWNKRPQGIVGDASRSYEFALRGVAVEGRLGRLHGIGFFSRDKKDGLLNPDGTINKYVVMVPRFENSELEAMPTFSGRDFGLRRDAFQETMFGGAAQLGLFPGTYIGVHGWEATYDGKRWDPQPFTIVRASDADQLQARDAELFESYDSTELGDFRRVVGAEAQAVYQNVAVQGEYAKLDSNPKNGLDGLFSNAPDAFTFNVYTQWEDLNLQVLWRDYDVGFDNPYARAFSQDQRFDQTLLGDPFRLENPVLSWLSQYLPQPKAERGLHLAARYRITRNLTLTGLEFDQWQRVADGQDLRRYVARLEYAPIFPLRFRLRQRVSSRGDNTLTDVRGFNGWDTRLETIVRLSGFDQLRLLYNFTQTKFAPRPRLSGSAEPGDPNTPDTDHPNPLPQAAAPAHAVQAVLEHNVNDGLLFVLSTEIYDGFLYNFEDNEFVVLDDIGIRNWFLVRSRLSDRVMLRFKLTSDKNLTQSNVDIRRFNDQSGFLFEGNDTRSFRTSFRLQADFTF